MSLNCDQLPIVTSEIDATLKTIAGAGTGKTRVLVERYLKFVLEDGIAPDELLALTFTTKAASEMRERVFESVIKIKDKTILHELYGAWIMNFHQFCFRVIKENAPAFGIDPDVGVATEIDLSRVRAKLFKRFETGRIEGMPDDYDDDIPQPAKFSDVYSYLMGIINKAKSALWTPDSLFLTVMPDDPAPYRRLVQSVCALWRSYETELENRNLIDFSDMMRRAIHGLKEKPWLKDHYVSRFKHILVDEFQDTSEAQNELLRVLSGGDFSRVTVVGDDKQAIYRWRDARVENLREFCGDKKYLKINYRSTQNILDIAHYFIVEDSYFARYADDIKLEAHRGASDVPICVFHPEDESPKSFEAEARALASWILSITDNLDPVESAYSHYKNIRACDKNSRPLDFGDVAVLMRSVKPSSGLPEFEKEFQRVGIPYVISGGVGALEVRVLGLFRNCLRLLIHPDDAKSLLSLLESRPFCLPDQSISELFTAVGKKHDVASLLSDDALANLSNPDARESCRRLRSLLKLLGEKRAVRDFPTFVSEALELSPFYCLLFDGGADDRLVESVIKTIFEVIHGLSKKNESNLAAFLESIDVLIEKRALESGGGPSLPAGRVKVMTIHSAKGLEFPAVAVPGIKKSQSRKEKFSLAKEGGLLVADGDGWGRGLDEPSETGEAETGDDQEERCLLYVAMTRAEDHLYLSTPFPSGVQRGGKVNLFGVALDALKANELVFEEMRIPPTVAGREADADGGAALTAAEVAVLVDEWRTARERIAEPVSFWRKNWIESVDWRSLWDFSRCPRMFYYSQVIRMGAMADAEDGGGDNDDNAGAGGADGAPVANGAIASTRGVIGDRTRTGIVVPKFMSPAEYGTYLHEVLAEWLKEGGKDGGPLEPVLDRVAARIGYSTRRKSSLIKIAGELVGSFAETPLGSSTNVYECEWPVRFRFERALFNGVIDRVDKTAAGYRIIDYKLATRYDEYHYQIQFYAWMLGRHDDIDVEDGMICYLKTPGETVNVDVGAESIASIEADARALEDAMTTGCFDAAPDEKCSSCRFRSVCPSAWSTKPVR